MPSTAAEYAPQRLAREAEQFWRARRLPPKSGIFGPPDGPVLHQFEGGIVSAEEVGVIAARAVAADVDARYLMLVGRRSDGTLRWSPPGERSEELPQAKILRKLAVWTGGIGATPWDAEDRHATVEALVGRLAHRGVIVSRDLPMRFCPTCVGPRSPERIIYQEEEGDAYLIRIPVPLEDRVVNALLWIDAPWRLLGMSAVLLHPDARYVIARYRRAESEELVLTSRSSLERFREWIPGAVFEVLEERPGREFAGRRYVYPLRHEYPLGGSLPPPGGTVLAVPDVTGTGTGIVPLVPGHQSTDALIAESHGIPGWPLVTPKGQLDVTQVHKYAGLDLKTASEFIVRDLTEGDAVFADLRVRRGVPHCMVCGTPLIWFPGRAWCLEPGRLPPEAIELYRRLLPGAPPLHQVEVAPWPISETSPSTEPSAVALLECGQCDRLDALDGAPSCRCGGKMLAVRRPLVPSAADAFGAWARHDPLPAGDSVRLYVSERRRVPALVHHLAGLTAVGGVAAGVAVSVLPTLPEIDLLGLVESEGTDAVRAALVRTEVREGTTSTFQERCGQERRRLERLWRLASDLFGRADPQMLAAFLEPIAGHLGELETEDRALLARWERTRVAAIADYDRGAAAQVHRRLFRFLETDLADYRRWVRHRLAAPGSSTSKRSALRTVSYVLRTATVLLGPILPYTADAIFRRCMGDRLSLFETGVGAVERPLLDEPLSQLWDRWGSFLAAVAGFRRTHAIDPEVAIPRAAIVLASDEEGDRLRGSRDVLERLARISRLEIASPREPWVGRQRQVRPIESEIQRVYPTQASQITHLLRRMPSRRSGEPSPSAELSVVIQGLPRRVLPSMVDYVETLPEGMIPSPWGLGELYLEIPGSGRAQRPTPPPLSPDAFWLVRHLERRLRRSRGARDRTGLSAVISAADPLASELRSAAIPLARYLEVAEVRVPESIAEPPPPHCLRGRARTGTRWWIDLPGLPPPTHRTKGRVVHPQSPRVPTRRGRPSSAEVEVDYADERVITEEEAVRTLNRELDAVLHSAVLGPAKIRAAWKQGYHDLGRYRSATFDELLELPGFGRGAAEGLVVAFGGTAVTPSRGPFRPRTSARSAPPRGPEGARPPTVVDLAPPSLEPPSPESVSPPLEASSEPEGGTAPEGPRSLAPPPEVEALPPPAAEPAAAPAIALPGKIPPSAPAIPAGLPATESPISSAEPSSETSPPVTVDGTETVPGEETPADRAPEPEPIAPAEPDPTTELAREPEELPGDRSHESPPTPSEEPPPAVILEEPPLPLPPPDAATPSSGGVAEPASPSEPESTDAPSEASAERSSPVASEPLESGIVLGLPPEAESSPSVLLPPEPPPEEVPGPIEEALPARATSTAEQPIPASFPEVPPPEAPYEPPQTPEEPRPEDSDAISLSEPPPPGPAAERPEAPSALERANAEVSEAATEEPAPSSEPLLEVPESVAPSRGQPLDTVEGSAPPTDAAALTEEPTSPAEVADSPPAEEPAPAESTLPASELVEVPTEGGPAAVEEVLPTEPEPTSPAEETSGPPGAPDSSEPPVPPDASSSATEPSPAPETVPSAPEDGRGRGDDIPEGTDGATVELETPEAGAPIDTSELPPTAEPPTEVEPPVLPSDVQEPLPPPSVPRGGVELMVGASVVASLQPFLEATAAGLKGVCVVRESPERIRAHAGSRPIEIYWLTNLGRGRTVRPNDLAGFATFLLRAMDEEHAQLFFIEGVEYLTHIHGVEAVAARLAEFDRLAREREVRVWLHVTPGLLRPGELERIASALPPPA